MSSSCGSLTWQGDEICLRFKYDKRRFAAVKKIPGAKYVKETKKWHLPLLSYGYLARDPLFSPVAIRYELDKVKFESRLTELSSLRAQAVQRLAENPFCVSRADLELVSVDLIVRESKDGLSLRAYLAAGKRKAKKLLEDISGAHYVKTDRSYFVPVLSLRGLLSDLRDKGISFAVEEELSKRLRRTAEIRQGYSSNFWYPAQDLAQSYCAPLLCANEGSDGEVTYSLHGYTTEQLRLCVPEGGSYSHKKGRVSGLKGKAALELLYRAKLADVKVFLSEEAQSALAPCVREIGEKALECYPDELLSVDVPKACWTVDREGRGGLLIRADLLEAFSSCASGRSLTRALSGLSAAHLFLKPPESKLLGVYEEFSAVEGLEFEVFDSVLFSRLRARLKERAKLLARAREYAALSDASPQYSDRELLAKLFPHQRVAVSWLLENACGLLGDDMGLGKTLSVLAAVQELGQRGAIESFIVVCPHSLVRNWMRECEHWTPQMRLQALPSSKKERQQALAAFCGAGGVPSEIRSPLRGLVINYETLRIDGVFQKLAEFCREKSVFLCVDESQRVKNPKSKSFVALQEVAQHCFRRILLSGTPTPKDISDIWGQMLILDQGERLGTNYFEWLSTVAELGNKFSDYAVKRFIPERVDEVVARVQEVLLRRKKENVLNLPSKTFCVRDIELKGAQKKRYDEVREELLLRVSSTSGKEFTRKIESVLEEYLRAVQSASNPRLIDPLWEGDPAKFVELDAIVKEVVEEKGEKLVVWTNYLGNVRELTKRYAAFGAAPFSGELSTQEKSETILKFQERQDSTIRVLIAVPAAGGVGITLTAAQTAVYVDKTWNAEHWLQSVDRIHRIGQTGSVNIISLNACKVDELIFWNLKRKERFQKRLLDESAHIEELYPSREQLIEALS